MGKYFDIVNYIYFQRVKRERLEYKPIGKVVNADGSLSNAFSFAILNYVKKPGLETNPGLELVNAVGVVRCDRPSLEETARCWMRPASLDGTALEDLNKTAPSKTNENPSKPTMACRESWWASCHRRSVSTSAAR